MSTVKIFSPGDWSDIDTEQFHVKVASTGLGFHDRKDAEKFADPEMLHWLSKVSTHPDCFYVYKTAMGGSHRYGPNRWGDGFREEVLEKDCKTFEQGAKAYRQHQSKGPYYGKVALARLRKKTGHVDLVTEYYGTDKVASLNGGKLADKELEALTKKGSIPVSMGSLVPGDRCVICEHWAPKPKDRCTSKKEGGVCDLFGCKTGMLKVAEDGRMNFVDNPVNRFYDISMVGTGADPIAYGLMLPIGDFQAKQAGMLKIAEHVYEHVDPDMQFNSLERLALDLGYHFANLEEKFASMEPDEFEYGFATHVSNPPNLKGLFTADTQRYRDAVKQIVSYRHLPDFESFSKAAGLKPAEIEQAEKFIPDLYTRLIRAGQLGSTVKKARLFQFSQKSSGGFFGEPLVDGLDSQSVVRRALHGNANDHQVVRRKVASFDETLPSIVVDYAAAKLAIFVAKETIDPLVLDGVVRREIFKGKTR